MNAADRLRLVNSVILPGFLGTALPAWLEEALRNGLGGVVYFSQNIDPGSPGAVGRLSEAVLAANPDAVIGIDEEGGNVTRLQSAAGSGIPGAAVLGVLDDTGLTEDAGRDIGVLARAAGVNLVLAPVADVNTNPLNPIIGVRSFGADTARVSAHTAALVRGLQSAGVGACAKHFPGHGDTSTDSHLELPRVELSLEEMRRDHLPPFAAAVEQGVAAVMSAHIVIPELGELPATLNPAAVALLRELGHDGLLVTDALDMAAVRAGVGSGPGAVLALKAGADLLCVGNPSNLGPKAGSTSDEDDYLEVRDALLAALDDGTLTPASIEAASRRIRRFAEAARRARAGAPDSTGAPTPSGRDWVEAAGRALTGVLPSWSRNGKTADPVQLLDGRGRANIAAGPLSDVFSAALARRTAVRRSALPDPAGTADLIGSLGLTPESRVVVLTDDLSPGGVQLAAARAVHSLLPGAAWVHTGTVPAGGQDLPAVYTHGTSRASAEALAARLLG
ncbi:glycoside hydrolase family 3 protein [Arthrobacter zhaoguopingii]|uniref:glycoside hydrolase family 3 protein n=1 Tax=Arthrobacter zhaoguopingii TaxID=2681491 RepID=UPI00135C47D3|nr:glycoside hydrolase family 3 N-terminal domain-containing protein [Arthrobacter zhaoguopingii]